MSSSQEMTGEAVVGEVSIGEVPVKDSPMNQSPRDETSEEKSEQIELLKSLSKKLSEGDVLETREYSRFLKDLRKSIKDRITALSDFGDYLADAMAEAERGASLGGADEELSFETEHSAALKEARSDLTELYKSVLEETQNQIEILERTVATRRRTDSRMASLFEQIFSESANVDKKLEAVNARIKSFAKPDDAAIQRRRDLRKRLDKIKRDRCILFGCVDIHPEELYQITGQGPTNTAP